MVRKDATLWAPLRRRFFSSAPAAAKAAASSPGTASLPCRLRPLAAVAARDAVADYLHATRDLPFHLSQLIASKSPCSLANLLSAVRFPSRVSRGSLGRSIRRHLCFFPLPELDFFLESIGCSNHFKKSYFLSDSSPLLSTAVKLYLAGFPWDRIGVLYSAGLLRKPVECVVNRLFGLAQMFSCSRNSCIIAACVEFPSLLVASKREDFDEGLLRDIRAAIAGIETSDEEGGLDTYLPVFRKLRWFYDAGIVPGTMGDTIGIAIWSSEADVRRRLDFFRNLGMRSKEVGPFVLQNSWLFNVDMERLVISVPDYLGRVGVTMDRLAIIRKEFPHVIGRNRLINLPGVLHAVGLADWFLAKIVEDRDALKYLSSEFVMADLTCNMDVANEFSAMMEKMKSDARLAEFLDGRIEFLLSIGCGENKLVARAISQMLGMSNKYHERFVCLRKFGLKHSELCKMVIAQPTVLNNSTELIEKKVSYLVNELGYPVEYLLRSPRFLCYDIEKRVKPRYSMLKWLSELCLLKKIHSPATLLEYTDKGFILHLYDVHPAAPKQWLECFSSGIQLGGNKLPTPFYCRDTPSAAQQDTPF